MTVVSISLRRFRTRQPLFHGPLFGPSALLAFLVGVRLTFSSVLDLIRIIGVAVNVTLAFCMGQDLEGIMSSSLGQPMAQIFFNSFGKEGTLAMWSFIIIAQYMMGSSLVRFAVPSLAPAASCFWADNHFRCLLPHANLSPCRFHAPAIQQLSDYCCRSVRGTVLFHSPVGFTA